ncbi:MAG: S8 family serine peptidase [Kiritimatiellia bacterium]
MKQRLGLWLAYGVMGVAATLGAPPPLLLAGGDVESASGVQQAMFRLLKSSALPPIVQRATSRGTVPWLVQMADAIGAKDKPALAAEGAVVHRYVPERAFLIEAAPATLARIAAMDEVCWAGEYLPAYKKSLALDGGAATQECVVTLFDPADKRRVAREFGELNVFVPRAALETERAELRVRLTPAQIDEVANWAEVEWIEPFRLPRAWGLAEPETFAAAQDLDAALARAFAGGARVHAVGAGIADAGAYGQAARAVDRFVWKHPEMLVLAAAGNAAVDLDPADGVVDAGSVGTPATAKNALAVGAAEGRRAGARVWSQPWPEDFAVEPIALDRMAQADGPQGLAAFSGRGPCADGRIKPDLVAPGTYVVAPRPADSDFTGWGVADNPNEIYVGGTGVAAEQVAAAAQQARQWLIDARGLTAPSAALVKAVLIAGARDLAPGQYGSGPKQEIPSVRPNSTQGFGMLDLALALEPAAGEAIELHDAPGLAAGAAEVYELDAGPSGGRFALVLAYADPAAAPCAGRQLVNDLDLKVRSPSGALAHAIGRSGPDDLNNVEMIEFEADEAGVYLARVEARAVPLGGSQPYALVVRGPRLSAAPAATLEIP